MLLLVAASTSGFSGLFLTIGSIGAFTSIYVLTTGRRSWAVIPTRKIASVVLAGALVAVFVGSSLAPASFDANLASTSAQPTATATPSATPSPTPSPTPLAFTVEAPTDPATSTPAPDAASIVLADTSGTDTTAVALLATLPIKGARPRPATTAAAASARPGKTLTKTDATPVTTSWPAT
ncbi:hypothetical protein [Cryobacterium sp. Hh7]|uniref:hypothetical protein n=1 Tax=Cryobacterium sp. Hh7 TaxID=1259159 RepID=UPI001F548505|nr:hypothetical protein [Cryobacterium sp. Hh7]